MPLHIVRNDIITMKVDAVVNAAKESLLGGGGVDGAIHRAAGPELLAECRTLGGCKTGQAKITEGYRLPAKFVIHTVGPIWRGGSHGERELLASAYRSSLELALVHQCETVAFPLISSGVYGYPKDQALKVAVDTIGDFLLAHDMTVYLVIFDRAAYTIGGKLFADIAAYIDDRYVDAHTDSRETQRRRMAMASMPMEESECMPAPCTMEPSGLDEALSKLDESFSQMLLRKIDECGMTDAQCYKKANIDRKLFSKIRSDIHYKPSKPTAMAFAVALELPLEEAWERRALPFLMPASSISSWSISLPTGTTTSSKLTKLCSPLTRACWAGNGGEDRDMNKKEIYALLSTRNIWHEVTEHKAVYNMAEVAEIHLPYPEADAKNLFIRDDKKRNYYLITVKGNKRVDLKAFRQQNDTRPLSFASDQDLMDILGLIPGAVTPLGLLNDREHKTTFWLDKSFLEGSGLIGVHPNDNTATVWLKTQDLLWLLEENGTQITLFET